MKLLRYGAPGKEKPGMADKDGNIRDLSKIVAQIDDAMLSPRNLARLARVKPETLPIVRGSPEKSTPKRCPLKICGTRQQSASVGVSPQQ